MSDATVQEQVAAPAPVAEETAPAVEAEKTDVTAAAENTAEKKPEETSDAQTNSEEKVEEKQNGEATNGAEFKTNRKYDPSTLPVTDDPVKIRSQVCCSPHP